MSALSVAASPRAAMRRAFMSDLWHTRSRLRRAASWLGLALLLIVGCGRGTPLTMPVKGIVTFQGSPLAEADVAFTPKGGRPASGRTDAAGRFTLTTFRTNDGALIGQHTVTVCKHVKKDPNATGAYFDYVQVTPEKFGRPNESPLRADVTASGPNEFTFDITPQK